MKDRTIRATAVLAISIAGSVWALGARAQEVDLATWGGAWGDAIQEGMIEPFQEETGIEVKTTYGVSSTNLAKVAAQRDNPQTDAITMVSGDGIAAWNDGLTEALDPAEIPSLNQLTDIALYRQDGSIIFAGMWTYPMGILYRTDKITWEINSWDDLWDPRLKNKVAVPSPQYANSHFLVMVNKLAGGDVGNIDPGFQRIKELGENLLASYSDDVTPQRMVAQGEIWAVPMLSAGAYNVIDQGVPAEFIIPKEGAPAGMDVMALVKNAPHREAAVKFINHALSEAALGKTVEILGLTALNTKVELSPEAAKHALSEAEMDRLITFDEDSINKNKPMWLERWNREIAPMTSR